MGYELWRNGELLGRAERRLGGQGKSWTGLLEPTRRFADVASAFAELASVSRRLADQRLVEGSPWDGLEHLTEDERGREVQARLRADPLTAEIMAAVQRVAALGVEVRTTDGQTVSPIQIAVQELGPPEGDRQILAELRRELGRDGAGDDEPLLALTILFG